VSHNICPLIGGPDSNTTVVSTTFRFSRLVIDTMESDFKQKRLEANSPDKRGRQKGG
jgi:hypothetical protein